MPHSAHSRRRQAHTDAAALDDGPAPEAAEQPRRRSSEQPRKRAKVSADAAKATGKGAAAMARRRSGRHQQDADASATGGGLVALAAEQPRNRRSQPNQGPVVVSASLPHRADATTGSPAKQRGMRLAKTLHEQPAAEEAKADDESAQGQHVRPARVAGMGLVPAVPAQRARRRSSDAVARRAARTVRAQTERKRSGKRSAQIQQGAAKDVEPLGAHSGRKQPLQLDQLLLAAADGSPCMQSVPQQSPVQQAPARRTAAAGTVSPRERLRRQQGPAAAPSPVDVQHQLAEPAGKRRREKAMLPCTSQDAVAPDHAPSHPKKRKRWQREPATVRSEDGEQLRSTAAPDSAAAQQKASRRRQPQAAPPDAVDAGRLDERSPVPAPARTSKRQRRQPAAERAAGHDQVPESARADPVSQPPTGQARGLQEPATGRPDGDAQRPAASTVAHRVEPEERGRGQRMPAMTLCAASVQPASASALTATELEPARSELAGSAATATAQDLKSQIRAKRARPQPPVAELPLTIGEPVQRPHQSPRRIRAAAPPPEAAPRKEVEVSRSCKARASVRRAPDSSRRKAAGRKAPIAHGPCESVDTAAVAAQLAADHLCADELPGCSVTLSAPRSHRGAPESAPAAEPLLPVAVPAPSSCDAAGVRRADTEPASDQGGRTAGVCQSDSTAAPDQLASPGPGPPLTASDPVQMELLAALRTFEDGDAEQRQFHECVSCLPFHMRTALPLLASLLTASAVHIDPLLP